MVLNVTIGLAEQVGEIARAAGRVIMDIYQTDFDVERKGDNSPVTAADRDAEALIVESLRATFGTDYPMIGEEAAEEGKLPNVAGGPFWLIDPLDGTKEFVSRNGEFTVNIALIENGRPVLGVVHMPVSDDTYLATPAGSFAQYGGTGLATQISCRTAPSAGITAIASRSHATPEVEDFLKHYKVITRLTAGSSLKFCRVAEGKADLYPRLGPTSEWDTAAGQAVLMYAGGEVVTINGRPLKYGKPRFLNPHFIARGPGVPNPQ
ncbi:MAG: 3'(2'),5'-bisphosphate nucleotidase CysQ [Proteobacteria bacterium]|nr:3'(2'),5'-bisphosphate nucleotidase CysQ [Pseudomonadota bacterium]